MRIEKPLQKQRDLCCKMWKLHRNQMFTR